MIVRSIVARAWIPVTIAGLVLAALGAATKAPKEALVIPSQMTVTTQPPSLSLGEPKIAYAVRGSGQVTVSYITQSGELKTSLVDLPWRTELTFVSAMRPAAVTATGGQSGTPELCTVAVDGKIRVEQTTSGGTVACSVAAV